MHVKFIARGTGSAKAAADYLLGERDAAGHLRDGVEIRRGDPHLVAAVADSLAFKHKYTSGVIAWAPRGPADRRADRGRARQVREDGLGRARVRPLRLVGGRAPRAERRCARAHLRRPLRPRYRQEPEHRAARLAADLRPAARRLQPRARLEPARRPRTGQGGPARPPRLDRRGEAAGRPGGRGRPARGHPRLPAAARRAPRRAEPRRRRRGARGGGPRRAAPGQGLRDRPRPGEREAVAAEGSTVRA